MSDNYETTNADNCVINARQMFLPRSLIAGVTILSRITCGVADSANGLIGTMTPLYPDSRNQTTLSG